MISCEMKARRAFQRLVIALSFRTLKSFKSSNKTLLRYFRYKTKAPSFLGDQCHNRRLVVGGGLVVSRPRPGIVDIRGFQTNETGYRRHTRVSSALDPDFNAAIRNS